MSISELPNIYFFIDTCARVKSLTHAFEAATDLMIAADAEKMPGWERKARITNVMTYQIFRELANTTEPGMKHLSGLGQQLLRRPEFNLVVETPVCRRFLSRLHEKCIKPYIIDAILAKNPKLCDQLLEEAERLRQVVKNGNAAGMKPIQLFDAYGVIHDSYVVQALRSTHDGSKKDKRVLWDHLHGTNALKYARKDAGEFSILTALTNRELEKPFSAVIVTKDDGAREMFKAAYEGKLNNYCKEMLKQRRKNPRTKNMEDGEVMPYDLPGMVGNDISRLPQAYVLNERGFADWFLGLQSQADWLFSKKMIGGKANRMKYPETYEKLQVLHVANVEIAESFGKSEETKNINEAMRDKGRFGVENVVDIAVGAARKSYSLAVLRERERISREKHRE